MLSLALRVINLKLEFLAFPDVFNVSVNATPGEMKFRPGLMFTDEYGYPADHPSKTVLKEPILDGRKHNNTEISTKIREG